MSTAAAATDSLPLKPLADWSASARLAGERETLGLYLTGHPIAPFEDDLGHFASGRIAEFAGDRPSEPVDPARSYMNARVVTLAGLIVEVRRRGARVSFMLDDRSGRMEVTMFEEVYQRHRDLVVKDTLIQVDGALRFDDFSDAWRIAAKQIQKLEAVRERLARHLVITCNSARVRAQGAEKLETVLRSAAGGQCAVMLRYRGAEALGTIALGDAWKVRPTSKLIEQLEDMMGAGAVRLTYGLETQSNPAAIAN
jgi:DNA polymerase-3 subunit alpha